MKSLSVPGSVITKTTASGYLLRLAAFCLADLSLESSVVLSDVEDQIVKAGFLTWNEVEAIEIAAVA